MDYAKITEAYTNLIKAIKDSGMTIKVSKNRIIEDDEQEVFIKIKASKRKIYQLKE